MMQIMLINPSLPRDAKRRAYWISPHGSAQALALAEAERAHDGIVVDVTTDTHAAHTLEADLQLFAGDATKSMKIEIMHFPDWETLPYDLFPPHPEIVSRRIAALYRLPSVNRGILVAPSATLMQRLAPRSFIGGSSLKLELRQKLDLQAEQRRLQAAGYRAVPQVG